MFYIHCTYCVSAQQTFSNIDLEPITASVHNKLFALIPAPDGIPLNLLRRMGKAVRMGISTGLPLIKEHAVNGIVIGTANGGMEDCIKFLNQIIDYEEGRLTPTNFVQSTTNAIAAQLGMMNANKGYNITHVHRGLSFENAVIDVDMLLNEHPDHSYLLGGVDEISDYNYNIEYLAGWFKQEPISNQSLYQSSSEASMAGEGAAMFVANTIKKGASAEMRAFKTLHTEHIEIVQEQLDAFLNANLPPDTKIDVLLTGENGDSRLLPYYTAVEVSLDKVPVARYKHMFGEFATASALALWLACYGIQSEKFPEHMYKTSAAHSIHTILLYHTHKGDQHSFMLVSKVS